MTEWYWPYSGVSPRRVAEMADQLEAGIAEIEDAIRQGRAEVQARLDQMAEMEATQLPHLREELERHRFHLTKLAEADELVRLADAGDHAGLAKAVARQTAGAGGNDGDPVIVTKNPGTSMQTRVYRWPDGTEQPVAPDSYDPETAT